MSQEPEVFTNDNGACRVITLNRPGRRNALGTATMEQLQESLERATHAPDINVVILTGAPPAFCAGSDLKELAGMTIAEMVEHESATAAVARLIGRLELPVIAAVEGYALGGGCILALSCDLVVSAEDARWAMPEVANGWLPPWGLEALISRVGMRRAQSVVWGALDCNGVEAHRIGMVDHLCASGEAVSAARKIALRLADLPPSAVTSAKRFFAGLRSDAEPLDSRASEHFSQDAGSPAAQAALARFAGRS